MPKRRESSASPKSRSRKSKPRAPTRGRSTVEFKNGKSSHSDAVAAIRVPGMDAELIAHSKALAAAAVEWDYILRNRRRWSEVKDAEQARPERAKETLVKRLGIRESFLAHVAASDLAEVVIQRPRDARQARADWPARVLAWEYLLTTATRGERTGPLTIVRSFMDPSRAVDDAAAFRRLAERPPSSMLFVMSAPGALDEEFSFDTEQHLVNTSLFPGQKSVDANEELARRRRGAGGSRGRGARAKSGPPAFLTLKNPTSDLLKSAVATLRPDAIHFAGFDTHQGTELLEGTWNDPRDEDQKQLDGVFLSDAHGAPCPVPAEVLAQLLTASGHRPRFVGFNVYNSAARIASLAVASGVESAAGFQDVIDDAVAEKLFTSLYTAWRQTDANLLEAFLLARDALSGDRQRMRGTAMVLWGARPWLGAAGDALPRSTALFREQLSEVIRDATLDPATAAIEMKIRPVADLNYSVLHNRRDLFDAFSISKPLGVMDGVEISVKVHAGADSGTFVAVHDFDGIYADLRSSISVPLTSSLWRTLRETMRTAVTVQVKWRDRVKHLQTYPINLLPLDEWRDTDSDRVWLPSFVLPRDEAVMGIVDKAQRYLMALTDDPTAGFDGYQSIDPDLEDPAEGVDLQVQAIWNAILHEHGLRYINPPPAFTEQSQRLRRPQEIISGGRGTCIDLALLFCACLEYVEIYPVMFLLTGHAFPGWWRTDLEYESFAEMTSEESIDGDRNPAVVRGQEYPWYFGRDNYKEIMRHVQSGNLRPIESTCLTRGCSFGEALEEGRENLRSKGEFESMADVLLARAHGVTPLPMAEVIS